MRLKSSSIGWPTGSFIYFFLTTPTLSPVQSQKQRRKCKGKNDSVADFDTIDAYHELNYYMSACVGAAKESEGF